MPAIGDIYQLVLTSDYAGEVLSNVFHYQLTAIGAGQGGADNLNQAFADGVTPALSTLVSENMVQRDLYTVCLNDMNDFHTLPLNIDGLLDPSGGLNMPSWVALSYRYTRVAAGQRYGYKRFGGLLDTQVAANNFVGNNAAAEALRDVLAGILDDNTWSFRPFIASRPIVYGTNPSGYVPGGVAFRGITSQLSRKP